MDMAMEETQDRTIGSLTRTIELQALQLESQGRQLEEMAARIKDLTAQLAWFQNRMFGRSSERRLPQEIQPGLFDPEEQSDSKPEEVVEERPDTTAAVRRSRTRRRECWDNLPVLETVVHEPEGVDLSRYRRMGEETTYVVEHRPGRLYRVAHVRPKYGLIDPTEAVERGEGVIIAPMPLFPIHKGIPGASLLAEILLQKYEYHMPFYRQIKQLAHLGMGGVKEATVTGWFKRTVTLLRPLYETLVGKILESDYCQADETTTDVINKATHQTDREYVWLLRSVTQRLAAFFYEDGSRAGHVIRDLTDRHHFRGYLQCDGFAGYDAAYKPGCGVTLVNCLVHIRRHFMQALEENRDAASWFLQKIQELYRIEHECDAAGMDPGQRRLRRLSRSKPLMEQMRKWMETEGVRFSPNSLTGKAVTYAYNRWDNMMHVLDDGRLLLDNNLAENEIRPITLGRKNWLFCGNHEAAGNMCVVTSLLATCRNHDVNPRAYLNDVIARMPYMEKAPEEELAELLPHRWILSHPEAVISDIRSQAK